jgi:hypothetical protein
MPVKRINRCCRNADYGSAIHKPALRESSFGRRCALGLCWPGR